MLLRRHRPPLWAAIAFAPLFYNLVGFLVAAVGYAAIGRPALVSILVVWIGSAARLVRVIDRYALSDSRRALAVVGALFWLPVSFGILVAVGRAIERL
jgi:hypothetical protein